MNKMIWFLLVLMVIFSPSIFGEDDASSNRGRGTDEIYYEAPNDGVYSIKPDSFIYVFNQERGGYDPVYTSSEHTPTVVKFDTRKQTWEVRADFNKNGMWDLDEGEVVYGNRIKINDFGIHFYSDEGDYFASIAWESTETTGDYWFYLSFDDISLAIPMNADRWFYW